MPDSISRHGLLLCFALTLTGTYAQKVVPIQTYAVGNDGRAQLTIDSRDDHYYLLQIRHEPTDSYALTASLTPGREGATVITEAAASYPQDHYRVLGYPNATPADTDGDGVYDLSEYADLPRSNPLNAAPPVPRKDGVTALDNFTTFRELSLTKDRIAWSEFLNGKGYVKFIIVDFHTDRPKLYFINSNGFGLHADFANGIGIAHLGDQVKKGQVIFDPTSVSANGTLGTYAFNYSNGHGDDFTDVRRTYELLAASMPMIENNLAYYVTELSEDEYARDLSLYQRSRIPLLFEADVFAGIDYLGLNPQEGYGIFRHLGLGELPGPRDIVLYDALPNDLPRVAGLMTSVIQTPLSHVNLRAIQNEIPNAFVRDPLAVDSIAELLDRPVYYRVDQRGFELREASLAEVNDWFDELRPTETQRPPLNLEYKKILPLTDISFSMYDGFGAKCANVATMGTFGFPAGTTPEGYGVPFYFYREFMEYTGLFDAAVAMMAEPDFVNDRAIREERLKDFRKLVRNADLPVWMMEQLSIMQASFPSGTPIRCRSSTNNEDLPGFNGAGLYDSKTQHPDEGHISKSIKQVYASLWNLRAFEERDYHRVDHFTASMGVLCHPNYEDERVNGVGVSTDPLYNTENTFYLNTQVGEDLVTNPGSTSIPEELLLERVPTDERGYIAIQRSNLAADKGLLMGDAHLNELRQYLATIHDRFAVLYGAFGNPTFAMDIEYKITVDDRLIIKQARPWVTYVIDSGVTVGGVAAGELVVFPNPTNGRITIDWGEQEVQRVVIVDMLGRRVLEVGAEDTGERRARADVSGLQMGVYSVIGLDNEGEIVGVGRLLRGE